MTSEDFKRFMEKHPYWKIFKWHPLNLALDKDKDKKEKKNGEKLKNENQQKD